MQKPLKQLWAALLGMIYPSECLFCQKYLLNHSIFCSDCFSFCEYINLQGRCPICFKICNYGQCKHENRLISSQVLFDDLSPLCELIKYKQIYAELIASLVVVGWSQQKRPIPTRIISDQKGSSVAEYLRLFFKLSSVNRKDLCNQHLLLYSDRPMDERERNKYLTFYPKSYSHIIFSSSID